MAAESRWAGVDEVAAHLGVAKDLFYKWINGGSFPAYLVEQLFRFKLSKLDEGVSQYNEQEKTPNSVQSQSSSKAQTNRSKPKAHLPKRGKNE